MNRKRLAALVPAAALAAGVAWWALSPSEIPKYDRDEWHPRWADFNGDCMDTRQQVLVNQGTEVTLTESGCRVARGVWHDPYSGLFFYDQRRLDIDHLVPLKEAHVSGGWAWDRETKRAYANDERGLLAVSARLNRQKGAKDPAHWRPPVGECEYAAGWLRHKARWGLTLDEAEADALIGMLAICEEAP